jgi:hypothetical protein
MPRRDRASFGALTLCAFGLATAQTPGPQSTGPPGNGSQLSGHVTDESDTPVAGARVTLHNSVHGAAGPAGPWETQTDLAGVFSVVLPSAGVYLMDVEKEGYYRLKDRPVHAETAQEVTVTIESVREVFQSVDVSGEPSPVDIEQTQNQERLTGTEINDLFYPNSHSLINSMKLMPGVVEDAGGGPHFNGSSGNQVQYLLNGFNIANPISGQFNTTLAVEGIRSLDFSSGRYSPEFGKGSAGVLAINTEGGTDKFHSTATDFIPGIDVKQGVRVGNWYPRVGVSGPIVRGRAWFSDTVAFEYTNALISGLPPGQNTSSGFSANNLLHAQANLTPRNIIFSDFLFNIGQQNRVGLAPLDPVSTTQTVRPREYFGSVKDLVYLGNRSMIEFGYAHNYFLTSQTPQGQNLYVFSPEGRSGNYFIHSTQTSSRDQGLMHGYAPVFHFLGSHQIQAGVDADLLHYNGNFTRTGYELVGLSGQILSETSFIGSGLFRVHDTEASSWLLDTWRITKRFQIDGGLRQDWDQRVSRNGWSPRASFSWAPLASEHTRVAGGYSVTHDAVPLAPFGQVLDQTALTTSYNVSGAPVGPPVPSTFTLGPEPLHLPRATNWNLNADHQISAHVYASVKYLRRRGTDGLDFLNILAPDAPPSLLPLPSAAAPGVYQLANLRRDDYDSFQLAVHEKLSGQYEWMLSYTRSRALSNAVLDPNVSVPLQVLPALIAMPWDSPNRVLGWAFLPLPFQSGKKWSLAALADARSGFPFSVQQQTGIISGAVDSHRYPFNFDLNLAIERMVTLHGTRFALRGGVDNLTNQKNSTAVNNVIGAPQYLQFFGNEGRHFVVRIRFFGRAARQGT